MQTGPATGETLYRPDGYVSVHTGDARLTWLCSSTFMADGQVVAQTAGKIGALSHKYLHDDEQGSVLTVTDDSFNPASPVTRQDSGYDAYGQPRLANGAPDPHWGSTAPTRYGYINQEQLSAPKLMNLNARLYDPQLGLMLSPDPIVGDVGDSQAWNAYAYARNNPMSRRDPTGLYTDPPTGSLISGTPAEDIEGLSCIGCSSGYSSTSSSKGLSESASGSSSGGGPVYTTTLPSAVASGNEADFTVADESTVAGGSPGSYLGSDATGTAQLVVIGLRPTYAATYFQTASFSDLGAINGVSTTRIEVVAHRRSLLNFQGDAIEPVYPIENLLGFVLGGTLVRAAASAAISALAAEGAAGLGDLTVGEVGQIQNVVDAAGRPLDVVGSAARGARTATSDIDYTTANANFGNFEGLEGQLPSIDAEHGLLRGYADPNIGPSIRFEPGTNPYFVPGGPR